jgi:hypothetical protein
MNAPQWIKDLPPTTLMQWHEEKSQMTMTSLEVVAQFEKGIVPTQVST